MTQSERGNCALGPDELRPTVLDIDLDVLEQNYRALAAMLGQTKIMPVLKANAYGHGMVACARVLEAAGASCLGVAFLEEAVQLRQAGIGLPILALTGISGRQIEGFLKNDIDITASSVMKLEAVEEKAKTLGKRARVHLKIDTGLERIGTHHYTAEKLLEKSLQCPHCEVVGIASHFATAESEDLSFAKLQLERFLECASFFEKRSQPMPLRHIANSAALLMLPQSRLDMVRPGLILYGISPAEHMSDKVPTQRVLELRSEVVFFKVVPEGAGVSYDLSWKAPRQTRIVTVPVGYGDGFSRRLSNRGSVLIRHKRYPIAGKVCMDQFMVDIGDGEAYNGDEVCLIGSQGGESISVEELSRIIDTDPRDVLSSLNMRVPRRFHYQGQVIVDEGLVR